MSQEWLGAEYGDKVKECHLIPASLVQWYNSMYSFSMNMISKQEQKHF